MPLTQATVIQFGHKGIPVPRVGVNWIAPGLEALPRYIDVPKSVDSNGVAIIKIGGPDEGVPLTCAIGVQLGGEGILPSTAGMTVDRAPQVASLSPAT